MNTKIVGLATAGATILCLATAVGIGLGSRVHAESTDESAATQEAGMAGVPNLSGQWNGTATISGEPLGIQISIAQAESSATGSCSISGEPTSFAVAFSQQNGNLGGTWSVEDKHPRPFSGSLNSSGNLELTLNAGAGKHPNCAVDVNGTLSDDDTEISGIFKLSQGCKNNGQIGTFQVMLRS
jgi:hypothetical protein